MRLFLALELPAPLRARLIERSERSRPGLPPARWVRSDAIHLTLVFLGEVERGQLADLIGELQPVFAARPPLYLRLGEVGAFPATGKARVLWAGVEADGDLEGLQHDAAAVAEKVLEVREKRPYHPHVTLARCSQPWPRARVSALAERFGEADTESFPIAHGTLFESRLTPRGAEHRVVDTFPLGGTEAAG